jgi:hypothetical protein
LASSVEISTVTIVDSCFDLVPCVSSYEPPVVSKGFT